MQRVFKPCGCKCKLSMNKGFKSKGYEQKHCTIMCHEDPMGLGVILYINQPQHQHQPWLLKEFDFGFLCLDCI